MNEEIKLKERGDALYAHLEQVKKIVPTLFLIGKCSDGVNALFHGSPKDDPDDRECDIGMAIYSAMEESDEIRVILLSAVSLFLMRNPESYMELRERMDEIMAKKAGHN